MARPSRPVPPRQTAISPPRLTDCYKILCRWCRSIREASKTEEAGLVDGRRRVRVYPRTQELFWLDVSRLSELGVNDNLQKLLEEGHIVDPPREA